MAPEFLCGDPRWETWSFLIANRKHLKKCAYMVERAWEGKKSISLNNFKKIKRKRTIYIKPEGNRTVAWGNRVLSRSESTGSFAQDWAKFCIVVLDVNILRYSAWHSDTISLPHFMLMCFRLCAEYVQNLAFYSMCNRLNFPILTGNIFSSMLWNALGIQAVP